jgi:hypothetical protein
MGAFDINRTVVLGTSPDHDTTVVVGTYRSQAAVDRAVRTLERKGFVTEVCEVHATSDIGN